IEVIEGPRTGHPLAVRRIGSRAEEPGKTRMRGSDDTDPTIRPLLSHDPVLDALVAVLGTPPIEQVEASPRTSGAPDRGVHHDVSAAVGARIDRCRSPLVAIHHEQRWPSDRRVVSAESDWVRHGE